MKLLEMLDPIQAAKMADRDNDISEILSTAGIDISMEGTISNSDEEQAPEPGAIT
jgi:hypothetical protein